MTTIRSVVFNSLMIGSMIVAGILCLPVLVVSRKAARWITLTWCRLIFWVLRHLVGLNVEVSGTEHIVDGPAIYAAKHQSALETFKLPLLLPQADIVLKRELLMIPVIGWFMASVGTVPVDRGAGARALRAMLTRARAAVAGGRSLLIFPEGTRTAPNTRQAFHPGVVALYGDLDLPVVPIALNTGYFWGRRSFQKRPGVARIVFLPPIPPGLARREFMETLEHRIHGASEQLPGTTL